MSTLADTLAEATASGGPFDPAVLSELDGRDEFPAGAVALLDRCGLADHYVPARHGGRLTGLHALITPLREVARHDLTVAVAHAKSFLGAAPVWVGGTEEQAAWLAGQLAGGVNVSWGLTERGHGSDLLATELTAERCAEGWRLDGEKWLINNATRGELSCVLARTEPDGGPRGFSLFLVDKRELPAEAVQCLPRERTHGIRGADISGIALRGAVVAESAMVGARGAGIEIVLTALQLTRTICAALSLGAGEHAVALTADFLRGRRLYERPLSSVPVARRAFGRAASAVLLADAATTVAARMSATLPAELSVVSAVLKAFVPTTVERALEELADLLGVRGFLTATTAHGMFAKIERDHRIVGIFDGSTPVNRSALITQLPRLARLAGEPGEQAGVLAAADLSAPLPELDPTALTLVSPTGCRLVAGLPEAAAALRMAVDDPALDALVTTIEGESARLHAELATLRPAREVPAAAFGLAERYEIVFAATASLRLWLHNPGRSTTLWLRAALGAACDLLGAQPDRPAYDQLAEHLLTADLSAGIGLLPTGGGHAE